MNGYEYIDFNGQQWAAIKRMLLDKREKKLNLLIQADTHDKSNQLRGSLSVITELLNLEDAAVKAAKRN